jgi:trehalose 6-phosphate synthase/phosphatase
MENINIFKDKLYSNYTTSQNRLFIIDYDGTLVPFQSYPQLAAPSTFIEELLMLLASDPANHVCVISGRDKETLENWLGVLPITLVAEHGGFYKENESEWNSFFPSPTEWKEKVYPAVQALVSRFEGSFIEKKHYSIVWHYRTAENKLSEEDKSEIMAAMQSMRTNFGFLLYDEDYAMELRTPGINKGEFISHYIKSKPQYDFVLALGDGQTDEDMFHAIPKDQYSIRVGNSSNSSARFYLDKQNDVLHLLSELISSSEKNVQQTSSGW